MKANLLFILFVLLLFSAGFIYFKDISPSFADKPSLEKPQSNELSQEHIIYLLNELDAYKLHSDPISKEPAIVEINVDGKANKFMIEDAVFVETEGKPDVVLYISESYLKEIFAGDVNKETVDAIKSGKISIETISDEKILVLKGYKAIYDQFSASNNITGNMVLPIISGFNVFFLLLGVMIINIVSERI